MSSQTASKSGYGLDVLEDKILQTLPTISHDIFSREYSRNWLAVKEQLEAQQANYITYTDYEDICRAHNLSTDAELQNPSDKSEAEVWLRVLESIGTVIHFHKIKHLRNIIVLKPEWIKQAAYAVLNCSNVIENHGRFTDKDFGHIWRGGLFCRSDYDPLLELMKGFELCYEVIEKNRSEYVVPSLFSAFPPKKINEFYKSRRKNPSFVKAECIYEPFMPAGVLNRLVVRQHHLIYKNLKWKTGVVFCLEYERTYAEIVERWQEKKIQIHLHGENCPTMFGIFLNELRAISADVKNAKHLPKLDFNLKIMCHCKDVSASCSFDYQKLSLKLKNRRVTQDCEKNPIKQVDIGELLTGTKHENIDYLKETIRYPFHNDIKDNNVIQEQKSFLKKKILFLGSNPKNTDRLRVDEELRNIDEGLQASRLRESFELVSKWAVKMETLSKAMLDYEPQIVHFVLRCTPTDKVRCKIPGMRAPGQGEIPCSVPSAPYIKRERNTSPRP